MEKLCASRIMGVDEFGVRQYRGSSVMIPQTADKLVSIHTPTNLSCRGNEMENRRAVSDRRVVKAHTPISSWNIDRRLAEAGLSHGFRSCYKDEIPWAQSCRQRKEQKGRVTLHHTKGLFRRGFRIRMHSGCR